MGRLLNNNPRYAAAARAVRKEIDTMPSPDEVVASLTAVRIQARLEVTDDPSQPAADR